MPFEPNYQLVQSIRDQVVEQRRHHERLPAGLMDLPDEELSRALAYSALSKLADEQIAVGGTLLDAEQMTAIVEAVMAEMYGLGRLQRLLDNEQIENIDANGCDNVWVTYASGEMKKEAPIAASDEDLIHAIQLIAHRKGHAERQFDFAHPELDIRLPDGSRLSAVMAVSHRPLLSIRRHRLAAPTLDDLVGLGMLDARLSQLLYALVRTQRNIMVAGEMNAGKTTLLRALAACVAPHERIVTVEQSFELGLHEDIDAHPNAAALEAREPNMEGEGAVSMRRLVRRTKRMNANRVIVGEVLGDEVIDMLTAMLQGRSGSMCTIHSESAYGTFSQVANYAIQSPEHLGIDQALALAAQALNFVVYVSLVDETEHTVQSELTDGDFTARRYTRMVSEVIEVVGYDAGQVQANSIYAPDSSGRPGFTGVPLSQPTLARLERAGFHPGGLMQ